MADDRTSSEERTHANARVRQSYAREAPSYDRGMDLFERWLLGTEHRGWACSKARGDTLEIAVGTGRNLAHYPKSVRLTGIDLSPEMLALARGRAQEIGREIELTEGDAQVLPFADRSFDTVVCTYALCGVPDDAGAIAEMRRVLKPGGRLVLVDHIRSSVAPIFWLQRLYELFPWIAGGERMTRRPSLHVESAGLVILARDRLRAGAVERLMAVKPGP
jgi:ubiquinone/menaquinone biosynthesis C-methylase UbiE